jgi:hypothetical protein
MEDKMERIIYQSACSNVSKCEHIKRGKECSHAKPLRRKGHKDTKLVCPYDCEAKVSYDVARCSCRKNEYIRWRALCHPSLSGGMKEPMLKEMSKKFNRCYGVFRRRRNGKILEGYCEASFSMNWDVSRVMPVSLREAEEIIRVYHKSNTDLDKHRRENDVFIVRITASGKNNPVIIDWNADKSKKYDWRNIPFKRKDVASGVIVNLPEELKHPVF